jgi:hypothetical protein
MPTLGSLARRIARVERKHGPLGLSVPGTDPGDRWRGPVVRRDPRTYQRQTSCGIIRCPWCDHWVGETNHLCGTCHIPLTPLTPET